MSTRITEEQKAMVVEEYKKGVSLGKLMLKYHIAQSTAYKLVQGYRQTITVDGQQLFVQDVAAILRENKRLKMENALLLISFRPWQKRDIRGSHLLCYRRI